MSWNFSAFHKRKNNAPQSSAQGGFGLIELMVSITVMVIVSSIILVRQSSFNSAVLLRSQAYEIALQAREVQLNAVGATNYAGGDFRSVLGLHFYSSAPNKSRYKIFLDNAPNNNHFYNSGEEYGLQGVIDSRFEVTDIQVDGISYPELSVVFERPNFDAHFYDYANHEIGTNKAEIEISQRDSAGAICGKDFRVVEITRTGQIAVQDCP